MARISLWIVKTMRMFSLLCLLAFVQIPVCISECDIDGATEVVSRFSDGIKSNSKTAVCQVVEGEKMAGIISKLENLLSTCSGDEPGLSPLLDKYMSAAKIAPNIASFRQCNYSTPPRHEERDGCSSSGLLDCTRVARDLQQIVISNPDPRASHPAAMLKLCKLTVNPHLLEVCMEANTANCSSTLKRHRMRRLYESEKLKLHQLVYRNTIALGCDTSKGGRASVDECMMQYDTLRSVLGCAPQILAQVYSEQTIDWNATQACWSRVTFSDFKNCVLEKSAKCSPLRTRMEEVTSTVESSCPAVAPIRDVIAVPISAGEMSSNSVTGCAGLPRELEAVLRDLSIHPKLSHWKVYGNDSGVSVVIEFGEGYLP